MLSSHVQKAAVEHGATFKRELRAYEPLVAQTLIAVAAAQILRSTYGVPFFHIFAGLWLLQFALIKFFDIDEFAGKFSQYDFFGARLKSYSYVYPFIQLLIGLAYLGGYYIGITSTILLIVSLATLVGLFVQVHNHNLVYGGHTNFIRAPLGDVVIVENTLMILMALGYFLTHKIVWGDAAFMAS